MHIEMTHRIYTDVDTYWNDVFFNVAFTKHLYLDKLNFKSFELVRFDVQDDGSIRRIIRTEPRGEIPRHLRRFIGDSICYVEDGEFDARSRRWRFTLIPSHFADKVSITGEMKVIDRGNRVLDRVVNMEVRVNVMGMGRLIESFVGRLIRESYDSATAFTHDWLNRP